MVLVLSVVLFGTMYIFQPISKDEAVESAMEMVPEEFTIVKHSQFISAEESESGSDEWYVHLENEAEERAILTINAHNGELIVGAIENQQGEVMEEL